MGNYLEQWFDASHDHDPDFDWDAFAEQQQERLVEQAVMAWLIHETPRRLGGDASPGDLKRDKRMSKGLFNRSSLILHQWGGQPADVTEATVVASDELKRYAAQLDWTDWHGEYLVLMRRKLVLIATTGVKNGEIKLANRYCNRLYNELAQVDQVYREYFE